MSMTLPIYCDPTKRHDFVFLFDVTNGNPNGDPDAGNQPRVDPETMKGFVTDVCLKRKVRDWIDMTRGAETGFEIYIQSRDIGLNDIHRRAHAAVFPESVSENNTQEEKPEAKRAKGAKRGEKSGDEGIKESDYQRQRKRRDWLCEHFYDIRTFGAVMSTGDYPSGQVRGPIQLTFAHSIDPISPLDIAITRVAVAEIDPKKKTTSTMGRKAIIPYGLYQGHGFFVPHFAAQTGYSSEDLNVFWQALRSMWDSDRSASRGMLALQSLFIFSHENKLGNAAAHTLFERVTVQKKDHIETPRHISDYDIIINRESLPEGVTLTQLV